MTPESDIRAIAQGNHDAFSRLYKNLCAPMQRYASGLLAGDLQAAEDAVDAAFMDIWQKASSFSGEGSAEGWIRRIVRNKSIDWLRKRQEIVGVSESEMISYASSLTSQPSPEAEILLKSDSAWLRSALAHLSFEHRETVWLCYFEEKSLSEIANICGCPQNTIKTRLFYARRKLKIFFQAKN